MVPSIQKRFPVLFASLSALALFFCGTAAAWSNGGYSDIPSDPDHGTHDWIAQHALDLLPRSEKQYLLDDIDIYLYSTELPDNPAGYGDTTKHHIYYRSDGSLQDGSAARRAQEEYNKSLKAIRDEDLAKAREYAGAMTHYIADMAVFSHVMGSTTDWGSEQHHSEYEDAVTEMTGTYDAGHFESHLAFDGSLSNITAYKGALDLAYDTTFDVDGDRDCLWMDAEGEVNHAPVITSMTADTGTIGPGSSALITVAATDPDGDLLTYTYSCSGGSFSGSGPQVSWTSPTLYQPYYIYVEVSDGEMSVTDSIIITVSPELLPPDHIVINELESNPAGVDEGNEWVELFNPTSGPVDLEDWALMTSDGPNATRPLYGTLLSQCYLVMNSTSQWLDNQDERISLLDGSGDIVDSTPVRNDTVNDERTWQRVPNGADTNTTSEWELMTSTKGVSNDGTRGRSRGYDWGDTAFVDRIGESLDLAVNIIADVLHHLAWESGYAGGETAIDDDSGDDDEEVPAFNAVIGLVASIAIVMIISRKRRE